MKRESESDGKENLFIHLASAQTAVCLWLLYIINSDFKGGGMDVGGGGEGGGGGGGGGVKVAS